MTGADLRAIRERLGLQRLAWGRALAYQGTDESVSVCVRRVETAATVPAQIARLAEMYERHGVPKRYLALSRGS